MNIGIPRVFGEIHDRDTQFTATVKQNQETILIGLFCAIIGIGYFMFSMMPDTRQGTWRYAVCKTFLERYSQFPTELKILTVDEKQTFAQIGYLTTNSYGAQQSALMECFYNMQQRGVTISRVTIDRKPVVFEFKDANKTQDIAQQSGQSPEDMKKIFEAGRRELEAGGLVPFNLDDFNKTIPSLMASNDFDLEIPGFLADSIADLKFE